MILHDYHRDIVSRYYGILMRRYNADALIRRIPAIIRIYKTETGFELVENRVMGKERRLLCLKLKRS
jgi:hypothetical protein